jgi:hypothetical protein
MLSWLKKWWPLVKALLAIAILIAIGRRFAEDLQEPNLWNRSFHAGWMILSGALYIAALGFSVFFWYRLLRRFGQHPSAAVTLKSYYVGFLGKYLPGKAWALVMRATLAAGPRVRPGLAGLTAFYEVLTNMAAGALLSALLFLLLAPASSTPLDWETLRGLFRLETPAGVLDRKILVLLALALLLPIGTAILPPVFNRLAGKVAAPFREKDAPPLPRFSAKCLGEGLLLTTGCWFLLGASLECMLHAVLSRPPEWTLPTWGLLTAYMGVAYVAGFVIVVVPSGLGVREFFLTLFLVNPEEGRPGASILLAVLLLRLVWTTAELITAAMVYWLPSEGTSKKEKGKREADAVS